MMLPGNARMRHAGPIGSWTPVILWMFVICLMSTSAFSGEDTSLIIEPLLRFLLPSITASEFGIYHAIIRKMAHVAEYLILGLLLFRAFSAGQAGRRHWQWAGSSLLVLVLYASLDEFHQSFTASRTASVIDVGIDICGGLLGLSLCILRRCRLTREQAGS